MSRNWREPKKLTPETLLKRDVRRYLTMTGYFCFNILQGLGAHKGISDIIAVRNGQVLFIEVKAPRGVQSPYQIEFERRIKEAGSNYLLIKDINELIVYEKLIKGE